MFSCFFYITKITISFQKVTKKTEKIGNKKKNQKEKQGDSFLGLNNQQDKELAVNKTSIF